MENNQTDCAILKHIDDTRYNGNNATKQKLYTYIYIFLYTNNIMNYFILANLNHKKWPIGFLTLKKKTYLSQVSF